MSDDFEYVEGKADVSNRDVVECPWCSYKYTIWGSEELDEEEINYCDSCGNPFTFQSEEVITYFTTCIKVTDPDMPKQKKPKKKKKVTRKKGAKK